jgi:glycosyltransferase involved in cell wall biosynthesis
MSGIYLEAARFAKKRFGAAIWAERGSRHILSQDDILAVIPGADRPSSLAVDRELAGYALADRIVIPSLHVEESFRRDPAAHAKLFRNPYGVDLAMFPSVMRSSSDEELSLLFVGTWSLRKGCDLLASAVRTAGVRLVHVGSISRSFAFPNDDPRFIHIDPVPQHQLSRFYAEASAFILASREDGLGIVLVQALASGLPVICTDRTGGADLAHTPALARYIQVIPSDDPAAMVAAISELRDRLKTGKYFLPLPDPDREKLSWTAYGHRYAERIAADFGSK